LIQLTNEQNEIIYSDADLIFVSARAGTGKTTTLVEFSKLRKSNSILYIVYNNSIKEEAKGKFPDRVTIHTIHSLAHSIIGVKYVDKITNNLNIEDIFEHLDYFKDKDISSKEILYMGIQITKVLNHFFNSEVEDIFDLNYSDLYLDLANQYWLKMKDKNNLDCLITHDGYLKIYQLTKPELNYDYIMIDEAQDSNEVMLDIVFNQKSKKIFVGDPHQKIYGFRGALNVFSESKYTSVEHEHYTLTESFRFGVEIANVANFLLKDFKNENKLIVGCDRPSVVGELDKDYQFTLITRTNTYLLDQAIEFVKDNKKIHIVGGGDFIFNQVLDAYYLYKNKRDLIKNKYMKTLKSFNDLRGLAKALKLPEHVFLVRIIDLYQDSLIDWIDLIKNNLEGKKSADVILTSAHKSKGLEFSSVKIGNDFMPLEKVSDLEEINILYVAITRATHDLELNLNLKKHFGGL